MNKCTPDMYKAMHELEWSYRVDIRTPGSMYAYAYVCPKCYQSMQAGHQSNCSLGKLLKELEAVK